MKKLIFAIMAVVALASTLLVTGCDSESLPQKPGGGGWLQDYDPSNGQYK